MKRKDFLSTIAGGGTLIPALKKMMTDEEAAAIIQPKYLKKGDTIGITCPAGFITEEEIRPAISQMESWGFNIRLGTTVGKREATFGGTDEERRQDMQQMLDDDSIRAIMCARGGYGSVRLVDALDFKKIQVKPKWLIGFSDITVLHSHLNRNYGIATIHSKMCNSFPEDWSKADPVQIETILSIRDALTGKKMQYTTVPHIRNRPGMAAGALVGGNLKTIESLSGSKSDLRTNNKLFFIEDTGEYLYSIDRMFWNLKRTGKLSECAGLIIGGFRIRPDDPGEEFGKTLYDIVMEKVQQYNYPVCFDFPVGHQKNNFALRCGVRHRMEVTAEKCVLTSLM